MRGAGPSYANVDIPCLCLCLGLAVHMTKTRPRRLTVLQNSHIFFTDDRTFMATGDQGHTVQFQCINTTLKTINLE
jgi:hypothetical protein